MTEVRGTEGREGLSACVLRGALNPSPCDERAAPIAEGGDATAEQLASDLEKLGPTFIKIGQFLSTRPDFVPLSYVEALSRLQDDIEQVPLPCVHGLPGGLAGPFCSLTLDG